MGTKPVMKQFIDLDQYDFSEYPIWVNCHNVDYNESWYNDTDEETFRPWLGKMPVNPGYATFLIKSIFTLNDGTKCEGFITPCSDKIEHMKIMGIIQPHLFIAGTMLGFWYGILKPSNELITKTYKILQRLPDAIFPIKFHSETNFSKGIIAGEIPGFCFLKDGKSVEVVL